MVTGGDAIGFGTFKLLKLSAESHWYDSAPEALSLMDLPTQQVLATWLAVLILVFAMRPGLKAKLVRQHLLLSLD